MERFLFREDWASALRAAGYASKDYVLLAKARIAVGQEADDAQRALDAVPPSLRYETSYLFARYGCCADGTSWTKPSGSSLT